MRSYYESLVGGNSSALIIHSVAITLGGFRQVALSREDLDLRVRICASHQIAFVPGYLWLSGYARIALQNASNMLLNWLRICRKFQLHFRQIPHLVHRWAHGARCAHFAESFA